jgi:cyclophilin family peptidyl-prolyl cis-trans isomerase
MTGPPGGRGSASIACSAMRELRGRAALCLLVVSGVVFAACGDDENLQPVLDTSDGQTSAGGSTPGSTPGTTGAPAEKPTVEIPVEEPTELVITTLAEGTGDAAAVGDSLSINYVGVLSADGTEFDNSYDRGEPIPVTLGTGGVIPGWDQGLVGIKTGERRQLDIPAYLAYGNQSRGDIITACSALTFVVEAVSVTKATSTSTVPPTIAPDPTVCQPLPPQADASECPATDGTQEQQQEFSEYPPTCIDVTKTYTAEIVTNQGAMTVELYADKAPYTVNNFVTLARYKYFEGLTCHRIIPSFVAQCGDPNGDGSGGPGYEFRDELPTEAYQIGSLAMANGGPNTNGSQFFIITGEQGAALPPQYSLFGMVTEGLDTTVPALDALGNPENDGKPPLEEVVIESITITEG